MRLHGLLLALSCPLGIWAVPALAGTDSGFLSVNITLNKPGAVAAPSSSAAAGIRQSAGGWTPACVSETLSEQTNALVRVVCGTEQFVNITPQPDKVFLATLGGALRFYSGSGFAGRAATALGGSAAAGHTSPGTVTVLRIYNAKGSDGPLQMLVSF